MKAVWKYVALIALTVAATAKAGAATSYADVAVVVNTNSATSVAIGAYFQSARSIPSANMIYTAVTDSEVIDSATFASLYSQIASLFTSGGLTSKINYIVTTKGCPLKVNREQNGAEPFSNTSRSSSVESELTLLLTSNASAIGGAGRFVSPYYNAGAHFSHATYGMYLVTRLDGYTVQDVYDLIDRSGPGIAPNSQSRFVFDEDPDWNSTAPGLNTAMSTARSLLIAKGKNVSLNTDTVYVTNNSLVLGYVSWGSNDHHASDYSVHAIPNNTWVPGAIIETYVSTSARSFVNPPTYGQSLIADLIAEGVSGAKGYVYEPYSSSMASASILFDTYTTGYNLAESYYQASIFLSWMDVIIGDPKTSIDGVATALPITLSSFTATPCASGPCVAISWSTATETQNYGFYVQRTGSDTTAFQDIQGSFTPGAGDYSLIERSYSWIDSTVTPGTYRYRLRQVDLDGTDHFSEAVTATITATTSVRETGKAEGFALHQNYPNPFNPRTTLTFRIGTAGYVTLFVYDVTGREVRRLVDGQLSAGSYSIPFDGNRLASGTYFCQLRVGNFVSTRSMALVR